MNFLITYVCIRPRQNPTWHYYITKDVQAWIAESQTYDGEEYYIINSMEVSEDWADKWDGSLKGQ